MPHPKRHRCGGEPPQRVVDSAAEEHGVEDLVPLLAYLIAGGAFLCAVLGLMTYGSLARIDEGFAVFG